MTSLSNGSESGHDSPTRTTDDPDALRDFFRHLRLAESEANDAVRLARESLPKLVKAAMSGGSQARVITAWLASVYNGSDSPGVQLDDIRGLDWALRKPLLAVVLGVNQGDMRDIEIREAFRAYGGDDAVDHLTFLPSGGAKRRALKFLVSQTRPGAECGDRTLILEFIRALATGRDSVNLYGLRYVDSTVREQMLLVFEGVCDGSIEQEDLDAALK